MTTLSKCLALLALFLYLPGILLPAIRLEKLGRVRESSLLDSFGVLCREREWLLAAVVGISALLLPPVKLLTIIWLEYMEGPEGKSRGWHVVLEIVSRFGLLEVFLSALLIALIRFDVLLRFKALPGLYLFILSALFGLGALLALSLRRDQPEIRS
jgi:paraquat-inducible protein A